MRATRAALLVAILCAAAAPPAGAAPGTLAVRQASDFSRGMYVEGSVGYVRVRDARGQVVVERGVRLRPEFRLRRRLPPGLYRLTSFQRPCSGTCARLDPPTDVCSRRVRVLPAGLTSARVVVRPGRGCTLSARVLPALFPPPERLRAVERYLRGRAGVNSFALIDSRGWPHGVAPRRRYASASVTKAMLLVAYLRELGNRLPSAAERATLGPMIRVSDNDRAGAVYRQLGDDALRGLARRARMRDFSAGLGWGGARFSAEDQARFFRRIDELTPPRSRSYARRLLSSIAPAQRWGFARFSLRRGFATFFKGGWRSTDLGRLVHEAALFERGRLRVSMAVLTDGNPSHAYGTATLRGVAARIFR